ncbi:hypothetical protein [Actinocatenispora rupis]|uniref:Uncharacterized protein n=1 Tax=Actinocatenispora rupis TaxID=519421 RepID=A0A8J3NF48_9ACTN|nr:hypothetical protein [Actinocatenispora rupis]GID14540.1 hypothetical protein Aru02nite_54290 [Actinocatenispora rupis]
MSTRTTANRGPLPALLRLVVTVQAVAVFVQAVTAGLLLSVPAGKPLHSAGAYTLFVVAMLHVPVAVLAWRPGGGSPRAILFAVVFLAVALVQVMLGIAHLTALHVPLGVLMFGGSVVQVVTIWTRRRAAAPVPA